MIPEKNSKADKAYNKGIECYKQGRDISDTPYISAKKAGLNSWFIKGWQDAKQVTNLPAKGHL